MGISRLSGLVVVFGPVHATAGTTGTLVIALHALASGSRAGLQLTNPLRQLTTGELRVALTGHRSTGSAGGGIGGFAMLGHGQPAGQHQGTAGVPGGLRLWRLQAGFSSAAATRCWRGQIQQGSIQCSRLRPGALLAVTGMAWACTLLVRGGRLWCGAGGTAHLCANPVFAGLVAFALPGQSTTPGQRQVPGGVGNFVGVQVPGRERSWRGNNSRLGDDRGPGAGWCNSLGTGAASLGTPGIGDIALACFCVARGGSLPCSGEGFAALKC